MQGRRKTRPQPHCPVQHCQHTDPWRQEQPQSAALAAEQRQRDLQGAIAALQVQVEEQRCALAGGRSPFPSTRGKRGRRG